jgi:hypothetical protein
VSKLCTSLLALFAALALLTLGAGPAAAGPLTDTLSELGIELPALPAPDQVPGAPDAVQPPAGADDPVPDVVGDVLDQLPAEGTDLPLPVPGTGTGEGADPDGEDAGADQGTEPPAGPAADAAAQCRSALAQAGLPGGDQCAALIGCFSLLPAPELGLTPEGLLALDPAALQERLDPAALQELLDPTAVTSFLSCLVGAIGLPPLDGGEPSEEPSPAPQPVVQPEPAPQPAAPTPVVPVAAAVTPVASAGQLAYTGVDVTPMVAAGIALLVGGGGLLSAARRRS